VSIYIKFRNTACIDRIFHLVHVISTESTQAHTSQRASVQADDAITLQVTQLPSTQLVLQ